MFTWNIIQIKFFQLRRGNLELWVIEEVWSGTIVEKSLSCIGKIVLLLKEKLYIFLEFQILWGRINLVETDWAWKGDFNIFNLQWLF